MIPVNQQERFLQTFYNRTAFFYMQFLLESKLCSQKLFYAGENIAFCIFRMSVINFYLFFKA